MTGRYVLMSWDKAHSNDLESPWSEGWDHHHPSPNRLGIWFLYADGGSRFVVGEADELNAADIADVLNDEFTYFAS